MLEGDKAEKKKSFHRAVHVRQAPPAASCLGSRRDSSSLPNDRSGQARLKVLERSAGTCGRPWNCVLATKKTCV